MARDSIVMRTYSFIIHHHQQLHIVSLMQDGPLSLFGETDQDIQFSFCSGT